MTIFVRATEAAEAKTKESVKVGIFLAGVLTVIAVLQLTTFDTFIAVLSGLGLPGGLLAPRKRPAVARSPEL